MRAHLRPYHYTAIVFDPCKRGEAILWVHPCNTLLLLLCGCILELSWGVCIAARLEPPFHTVFRSVLPRGIGGVCSVPYWWKPSCLCGMLFGCGALPVVPSFQTVPSADACGVGFSPFRAVRSLHPGPAQGSSFPYIQGSVAT
jgi:hypothetical protein